MGFISLNEAGNAVVATAEYVDGAIAVPTEGWAIGFTKGEGDFACYGTETDNLVNFCHNHFTLEVETEADAVAWFKTNVGPVFLDGAEV